MQRTALEAGEFKAVIPQAALAIFLKFTSLTEIVNDFFFFTAEFSFEGLA